MIIDSLLFLLRTDMTLYLQNHVEEEEQTAVATPKPPPIFVHGVQTAQPLRTLVHTFAGENFTMKTLPDNTVKIQVFKIEVYRILMRKRICILIN